MILAGTLLTAACSAGVESGVESASPEEPVATVITRDSSPTPTTTGSTPDRATVTPSTSPSAAPPEPGTISDVPCDDSAACAYSFQLNDVRYAVDCTAVKPSFVTDAVVGTGELNGRPAQLHVIEGIDPELLLALDRPGGGACYTGEPTEPATPWMLVIGESAEIDEIIPDICRIAEYSDERREVNGCDVDR